MRLEFLVGSQFLAGHILHLGVGLVGQNILGFADSLQTIDVALAGIHNVAQVLPFLRQFYVAVLVGYHGGVGNQRRDLFVTGFQTVELL